MHVPYVGSDCSAGPDSTLHFRDAHLRLRNEENHEGHHREIKGIVVIGQHHGIAGAEPCQRGTWAFACKVNLRCRRVDAVHGHRHRNVYDLLRKGAGTASDVKPAFALCRFEPFEKPQTDELGPDTHHTVIGRPVVKSDLWNRHATPPCLQKRGAGSAQCQCADLQ